MNPRGIIVKSKNLDTALLVSPAKICAKGAHGISRAYRKNHAGFGGSSSPLAPPTIVSFPFLVVPLKFLPCTGFVALFSLVAGGGELVGEGGVLVGEAEEAEEAEEADAKLAE